MAAVRNEPCALKFAMEEVQADPEVCEVALRGAHAALQFVSPALYEDRKILDALVEGYIQRRRSHEQPITVDQGLRELKEHNEEGMDHLSEAMMDQIDKAYNRSLRLLGAKNGEQ